VIFEKSLPFGKYCSSVKRLKDEKGKLFRGYTPSENLSGLYVMSTL
jgi:hypothetical protein